MDVLNLKKQILLGQDNEILCSTLAFPFEGFSPIYMTTKDGCLLLFPMFKDSLKFMITHFDFIMFMFVNWHPFSIWCHTFTQFYFLGLKVFSKFFGCLCQLAKLINFNVPVPIMGAPAYINLDTIKSIFVLLHLS